MARPRAIDDSELLPRVMYAFWRHGFARTGIRELESASGLKAPSLYHRFASKEALFQAALDHYLEVVVGMRIKRYLEAADPLRGVHDFFHSTYDHANAEQLALGCLLVNSALELGSAEPQIAEQVVRGGRMIERALVAALRRAQAAGQLRADADAAALARALHLGLSGLLVSARSAVDKASLRKSTRALLSLLPVTLSTQEE